MRSVASLSVVFGGSRRQASSAASTEALYTKNASQTALLCVDSRVTVCVNSVIVDPAEVYSDCAADADAGASRDVDAREGRSGDARGRAIVSVFVRDQRGIETRASVSSSIVGCVKSEKVRKKRWLRRVTRSTRRP